MNEMEENKVFVVTHGEYSDYHIERVFSTRAKALEYLDTKGDDYSLEVYDLDGPVDRKTKIYLIRFDIDRKNVVAVNTYCNERYKDLIHVSGLAFDILDIYVESDSRERAQKIASERYGSIIAGEQTMYPYLRVGLLQECHSMAPAFFDFNTGEIVLFENQHLAVELPDFIKVKRLTT